MVFEELAMNIPELENFIKTAINLLIAILAVFGIYIVLWLINFFFNLKRIKMLKRMDADIQEIKNKLDKLTNAK